MGSAQFKDYKLYSEPFDIATAYREAYLASIKEYLDARHAESASMRAAFLPPEKLKSDLEGYRRCYIEMLGTPLTEYAYSAVPAKETYVATDDLCEIYRVQLTVDGIFKFYGMLMKPVKMRAEKLPLVICQHGGGGTPELCSDMNGDNNYSHMTRRILEYGACVFAPQLLLWNSANYGVPHNRGDIDAELKRYNGSIIGLEVYLIMKAIDYMTAKPYIDETKIAMHGLSYGGLFTLYTMAADPRIAAGYSCACFNDRAARTVLGDARFFGSAYTFMDAEIAGLCAPRHLYIDVGKTDPVFDWENAVKEYERVPAYFDAFGVKENVHLNVWDGGHTVSNTDDGHHFIFDALGWAY